MAQHSAAHQEGRRRPCFVSRVLGRGPKVSAGHYSQSDHYNPRPNQTAWTTRLPEISGIGHARLCVFENALSQVPLPTAGGTDNLFMITSLRGGTTRLYGRTNRCPMDELNTHVRFLWVKHGGMRHERARHIVRSYSNGERTISGQKHDHSGARCNARRNAPVGAPGVRPKTHHPSRRQFLPAGGQNPE